MTQTPTKDCSHLDTAARRDQPMAPGTRGCAECLASGAVWVHLRLCLTCGHVGCCDDSPNKHATAHYHATQHPVIRSYEPGEPWAYCYVDDTFAEEIPVLDGELPLVHHAPSRP